MSGGLLTGRGIWKFLKNCPVLEELSVDIETCSTFTEDDMNDIQNKVTQQNWDIRLACDHDSLICRNP